MRRKTIMKRNTSHPHRGGDELQGCNMCLRKLTGMLSQLKCWEFCNSNDTASGTQRGPTTHRGLQICNLNKDAEEGKQTTSRANGSYSQTKQGDTEIRKDRNDCKNPGGDSQAYCKSQLPDGVRAPSGGELEAFRARCASLESNEAP